MHDTCMGDVVCYTRKLLYAIVAALLRGVFSTAVLSLG